MPQSYNIFIIRRHIKRQISITFAKLKVDELEKPAKKNYIMQDMKITKKQYILAFFTIVAVLAIIRCTSPKIAEGGSKEEMMPGDTLATPTATALADDVEKGVKAEIRFFDEKGNIVKNRIYSVPHFGNTFPDQNDVQLVAAARYGVKAVVDRADAGFR